MVNRLVYLFSVIYNTWIYIIIFLEQTETNNKLSLEKECETDENKEPVVEKKSKTKRQTRRTMSAIETFQVPDMSSLVLSAPRTKKRRKTQHDSTPKSPEEWYVER